MAIKPIRQIRIEGNTSYIPLTRGYEAIIDADDVPLVSAFNWTADVNQWTVYATRWDRLADGKQRATKLHRFILTAPDGMVVDHINGDGLDNRRANLRLATSAGNAHNRRINKNNLSGFKGVRWNKAAQKWQAQIALGGKDHYLGLFDAPEAAHAAYVEAATRLHGDFAKMQ